ncbi:MAG TPA: hypothetical protein PKA37_00860 [Planctomycetota bacterium]|jgi:hypothetical protein|nr:hypothetical protein [Planctomycetota bacterium]
MGLKMVLFFVVVTGLAACQEESRSTVAGLEWRLSTPGATGVVSVSEAALKFGAGLKAQVEARGLSLEDLGDKVVFATQVDLLVGERFLTRGEYRLGLMLGRGGASLEFRPVVTPPGDTGTPMNVPMSVKEDAAASHAPMFQFALPTHRPHEAELSLVGDGLRLRLSLVGMPSLVHQKRLTEHAERILRKAEQFSILALVPPRGPIAEVAPDRSSFHGYEILGEVRVRKPDLQATVMDVLTQGMRSSDGRIAGCFLPRHGIRAFHQGRFIDLVICYECLHMRVYPGAYGPHEVVLTTDVSRKMNTLFEGEGLQVAPR